MDVHHKHLMKWALTLESLWGEKILIIKGPLDICLVLLKNTNRVALLKSVLPNSLVINAFSQNYPRGLFSQEQNQIDPVLIEPMQKPINFCPHLTFKSEYCAISPNGPVRYSSHTMACKEECRKPAVIQSALSLLEVTRWWDKFPTSSGPKGLWDDASLGDVKHNPVHYYNLFHTPNIRRRETRVNPAGLHWHGEPPGRMQMQRVCTENVLLHPKVEGPQFTVFGGGLQGKGGKRAEGRAF